MIVRVFDYDYPSWSEGVPVLSDFGKWAFGPMFASGSTLRASKGFVMELNPLHRAVDVTSC